jgi:outer membrane protein
MFKKIVLFALIVLPIGAFAQDKIAYFNPAEIYAIMPEVKQMQDSLQKVQTEVQAELQIMKDEYNKKYQAFMNESEGLIESIKIRRMNEISDLEQRAQLFQEDASQRLMQTQQSLAEPIQKKVHDALQAVGAANNFLYILDASLNIAPYISPNAIDATPLVQKQLKL